MKKKPISIITFVTEINKNKMFLAILIRVTKNTIGITVMTTKRNSILNTTYVSDESTKAYKIQQGKLTFRTN